MPRRNRLIFVAILLVFVLSLLVVLPLEKGILGNRGVRLGLDLQGGIHIVYRADLSSVAPGAEAGAIDGVVAVLENRINPLGVTEPLIQKQGSDRIVLELPGLSITDTEKERLSRVALLEFGEQVTDDETARWEDELGKWKPATAVIEGQTKVLTSQYFRENTFVRQGNLGEILLIFEWDKEGSQLSEQITTRLIDKSLGIFEGDNPLRGEDGRPIAPVVRGTITDRGQIEGLSFKDATTLSQQLNAGRLPVPLEIIYDQTVSPILGADFAQMSVKAGFIGIAVIMLFVLVYYRLSGFIASLALIYYGVLLLAIFKLFGVTLTLAGIGGFILSLGMAVDANVLIFERIKEELWTGRSLGAAIDAGFNRAWPAIWDSNITTILAGVILFWLGSSIAASGPVKGFAITLVIGVASSMFTAITVTRAFLRPFIGTGLAQKTWLFAPYQRKEKKDV
ncbi:MAG: protein translocase subunit SecD [Chloroflexi bacterium]|nr:protein translocase subunit SecD [Chloroflexota bacterium]